jgi:two-component system, LuxR family, sensor kinase FixL
MNDAGELREAVATGPSRLQALMEIVPDGVLVVGSCGEILTLNASCERLFGWCAAEIVGHDIEILLAAPSEVRDGLLVALLPPGSRSGREVEGRRRDGTSFPLDLAFGAAEEDGRTLLVGIARDLTASRRAAAELDDCRRQMLEIKAKSLDADRIAMDQLASALAQELNQPLTAVINYARAVKRMMGGTDAHRLGDALDVLDRAIAQASRASEIVRGLRAMTPERGTTLEDLNAIVAEAATLALAGIADDAVPNRLQLYRKPLMVEVDKAQLRQVVVNLMRNAIEAMDGLARQELTVSTVPETAPARGVRVTVRDTGPGLPADVAERLFQPFVTTKQDRLGLSLSAGRSVVVAHGGRLWPEVTADGGVAFHLTLPDAGSHAADGP